MKPQIKIQKIYPYPIEKVWYAISKTDELKRWMSDSIDNFTLQAQQEFTITISQWNVYNSIATCQIINIDAPLRLAYTCQLQNSSVDTFITWHLKDVAEGTALTFEQNGFKGWKGNMERLIMKRFWTKAIRKKLMLHLSQNELQ